jgi:hypothetical protein
VKVVGYSYPWDYLDDPSAATRARDVGVDVLAVAASYHASRIVSPLHPTRRVMDVPHSAIYVPVHDEVWRGHRLIPRQPTWTSENDLFGLAQRQLRDVGLEVDAWIVLTHNDDLGRDNPDLVVHNAFGDTYPYALCPSAPDVHEYCLTLVEEIISTTACRGVVLEAWGPMGVEHASQHDKSDFASWSTTVKQLLSLCFCNECRRGLEVAGIDVEELRRRARAGVDGDAASMQDALGHDLAAVVLSHRIGTATRLRNSLVEKIRTVRSDATITLHASESGWSTGSFSTYGTADASTVVDTVVANCWNPATSEREVSSLNEVVDGASNVGAYVRLDRGWSDEEEVSQRLSRYRDVGMTEAHLYHLGLLTTSGIAAARRVALLAASFNNEVGP